METPAIQLANRHHATVLAAADAIDRERRLPADLVAQLKRDGVLRQLIPQRFGGLGVALGDFLEGLQRFAEADASTAWCINQGAVIGTTSLWLPQQSTSAIWQDAQAAVANGPPQQVTAVRENGHFRVTGRWGFSSGCQHATWMQGAAKLADGSGWVVPFFPQDAVSFHDNWDVPGLRGTGSFEFSVQDLEVGADWVADMRQRPLDDGVLYRFPTGLVFAVGFAAVALGVARAGLDIVLDLAQGKVPGYASQTLKHDPDMQQLVGRAEIRWRAARSFLLSTVSDVQLRLEHADAIGQDDRIALRMAGTHGIREAAAVLDAAYAVAGSSGIYRGNPLQRRFQDMHVITQHVQGRLGHYGYVGRYLLGHPFESGPLN